VTNQLAEEVAQIMADQELTLGTVECGVNGIVSRTIFDTEEGPAVLGDSLILDDVEKAVDVLDLPRPQFKKQGILSAKAARAAAREGQELLWVDLCLVVWGPPLDRPGEEGLPRKAYLALFAAGEVHDLAFEYDGPEAQRSDVLVHQALRMLRQALP
jgi:nicotinamide mononucleotide (NMN) deamidase PncC